MKNIPNGLSFLRIVLCGVFVYLFLKDQYTAALVIFAAAFFTDILDGYLARHFQWITPLGKLLDPAADKLLVLSALLCILLKKEEPFYKVLFTVVLVKEGLMIAGGLYMLRRKTVVKADFAGKVASGLFGAGIALCLLSFILPDLGQWDKALLSAAALSAVYALLHYLYTQMHFSKREKKPADQGTQR